LTQPFSVPDECNVKIDARQCEAITTISYHTGTYEVKVTAIPKGTVSNNYMAHSVDINLYYNPPSFTYTIDYICDYRDNCALDLLKYDTTKMLQRQFDFPGLTAELRNLISGPFVTPLNCYDSYKRVWQCGTLTRPGSCHIANQISDNTTTIECDNIFMWGTSGIGISQSGDNSASFSVYCNKSLCNTYSTLEQAKALMFKYNVTLTPDGRLTGSRLIISTSLMIVMILFLIFN
jgi:hypothetical protein